MKSQTVGVRQFRRELALYLEDAKDGWATVVTNRGKPIAMLVKHPAPAPKGRTAKRETAT